MYCSVNGLAPTTYAAFGASEAGQQGRAHARERARQVPQRSGARLARCRAALHQRQQLIDHDRKHRRRDTAEQHENPVLRLQAGEDVIAEAGLADGSRKRGGADHPHRRGADAGHDHRQSQRQFHHEQRLPRGHSDAKRGLRSDGIDAFDPRRRCCAQSAAPNRASARAPRAGSRARRIRRRTAFWSAPDKRRAAADRTARARARPGMVWITLAAVISRSRAAAAGVWREWRAAG